MRLQTRRPATVALAVAAGLLSLTAGCGAGPVPRHAGAVVSPTRARPGAAEVGATAVRRVSPINTAGRLRAGYSVTSSGHGYCWTSSFVNGRLYRCFEKNLILDPCWKQQGRRALVCQPHPWTPSVDRLRLNRRLPASGGYGPRLWGLRIGGGIDVNCLVSMGASGAVGNRPVSFLCARGWVLLGTQPDRSHPLWTMLTARLVGDHYVVRGVKPLTTAWKAVLP